MPADDTLDRDLRELFTRYGHGGFPVERDSDPIGALSLADVSKMARALGDG